MPRDMLVLRRGVTGEPEEDQASAGIRAPIQLFMVTLFPQGDIFVSCVYVNRGC